MYNCSSHHTTQMNKKRFNFTRQKTPHFSRPKINNKTAPPRYFRITDITSRGDIIPPTWPVKFKTSVARKKNPTHPRKRSPGNSPKNRTVHPENPPSTLIHPLKNFQFISSPSKPDPPNFSPESKRKKARDIFTLAKRGRQKKPEARRRAEPRLSKKSRERRRRGKDDFFLGPFRVSGTEFESPRPRCPLAKRPGKISYHEAAAEIVARALHGPFCPGVSGSFLFFSVFFFAGLRRSRAPYTRTEFRHWRNSCRGGRLLCRCSELVTVDASRWPFIFHRLIIIIVVIKRTDAGFVWHGRASVPSM